MKNLLHLLAAMTLIFSASCDGDHSKGDESTVAERDTAIYLADPTIFFHDGIYYLYGTGRANEGFLVYTSEDLKIWEGPKGVNDGFALREGDAFGDKGFWAPQVFFHNGRFYMAYTANEKIAIAESDSPLGPFAQEIKEPLSAPVKQIDPFVFISEDGTKYLYHVRVADGGNRLFVAEMEEDFSGIKPETLKECIRATETWENRENADWSVTEGPSLLQRGPWYYLVYSANDFRSKNYAVGYARSKSPEGPWEKYADNPILHRTDVGKAGTGHGDFFQDSAGTMYYVFHTHHNNTTVGPRRTAIVKAGFVKENGAEHLRMDKNSFYYLKQRVGEE